MSPLLWTLLLPLLGSCAILFIPTWNHKLIRGVSLCFSLVTFLVSLLLWIEFDNASSRFQFVDDFALIRHLSLGDDYTTLGFVVGIDGISLFFIILTTFLIPVCLLAGWASVKASIKEYCIAFLILESLLVAAFSVLDLLLFYIFFESVLIPMFLIIGVWGSRERKIRAAYQFFLYTLVGSLFMLLAILVIYCQTGTTDLLTLYTTPFSESRQLILWIAFFASFAVKVPMLPVHIWLPEAHVEAPTAGSVILAGILLKLGNIRIPTILHSTLPVRLNFFCTAGRDTKHTSYCV